MCLAVSISIRFATGICNCVFTRCCSNNPQKSSQLRPTMHPRNFPACFKVALYCTPSVLVQKPTNTLSLTNQAFFFLHISSCHQPGLTRFRQPSPCFVSRLQRQSLFFMRWDFFFRSEKLLLSLYESLRSFLKFLLKNSSLMKSLLF